MINRDFKNLAPFFCVKLMDAISECHAHGLRVELFEGFRSEERQAALFAQGRTKPGPIVTRARAGESWHQYGLAADVVFNVDRKWSWSGDWEAVHKIFKLHGFETLSFERPHVQITGGFTVKQAQKIAKTQGLLALWDLVSKS